MVTQKKHSQEVGNISAMALYFTFFSRRLTSRNNFIYTTDVSSIVEI